MNYDLSRKLYRLINTLWQCQQKLIITGIMKVDFNGKTFFLPTSLSHLCMAARSQSLAAPLTAQAGSMPVFAQWCHLLSYCEIHTHTHTYLWDTLATTLQVHTFSLISFPWGVELLTKIHLLVAAGAQVGLSGKSGDAASCWHITHTLKYWKLDKLKRYNK